MPPVHPGGTVKTARGPWEFVVSTWRGLKISRYGLLCCCLFLVFAELLVYRNHMYAIFLFNKGAQSILPRSLHWLSEEQASNLVVEPTSLSGPSHLSPRIASETSTEWSRRTTWWGGFSKKVLPLIAKEVDFLRSNLPLKNNECYTTENTPHTQQKKLQLELFIYIYIGYYKVFLR